MQRLHILWDLEQTPDVRLIAPLLTLVRSDPDGAMVKHSISHLSRYQNEAAIIGLIDALAEDYRNLSFGKGGYSHEAFIRDIAAALHSLTGRNFGKNREHWVTWWNTAGQTDSRFR